MTRRASMATRVAIGGLGSVGRVVARRLTADLPCYRLTAVSARRADPAREFLQEIDSSAQVTALEELSEHADLVIESAPAALFRQLAEPVLSAGKELVVLSAGALLDNWDLVELAERTGGIIRVPSGALLALDAVQAANEGSISSVRMVTRKPLAGLQGAPFIEEGQIDLSRVFEPVRLFQGTAREAVEGFPANLNVAVALSLAGIGPDRTTLEVWADPDVERNTHLIEVEADSASLKFSIGNVPSQNPKTGQITALSVIALLRKLSSPLQIGT